MQGNTNGVGGAIVRLFGPTTRDEMASELRKRAEGTAKLAAIDALDAGDRDAAGFGLSSLIRYIVLGQKGSDDWKAILMAEGLAGEVAEAAISASGLDASSLGNNLDWHDASDDGVSDATLADFYGWGDDDVDDQTKLASWRRRFLDDVYPLDLADLGKLLLDRRLRLRVAFAQSAVETIAARAAQALPIGPMVRSFLTHASDSVPQGWAAALTAIMGLTHSAIGQRIGLPGGGSGGGNNNNNNNDDNTYPVVGPDAFEG